MLQYSSAPIQTPLFMRLPMFDTPVLSPDHETLNVLHCDDEHPVLETTTYGVDLRMRKFDISW